jgi:hypothetical protein
MRVVWISIELHNEEVGKVELHLEAEAMRFMFAVSITQSPRHGMEMPDQDLCQLLYIRSTICAGDGAHIKSAGG